MVEKVSSAGSGLVERKGSCLRTALARVILVGMLFAPASSAEVRMVGSLDRPRLEVVPGRRGPWSPVQGGDHSTILNPNGDVVCDGFPGHAATRGALLVAWWRPHVEAVEVVQWSAGRLEQSRISDVRGFVGTPIVLALPHGWFIAWRSVERDIHVEAVIIVGGEVVARGVIAEGSLVDAHANAESVLVMTWDPMRDEFLVSRLPCLPIPIPITRTPMSATAVIYPQPIPIPLQSISVELRSTPTSAPPTQPIPIERIDPPTTCTALTDDGAVVGVVVEPGVVAIVREQDGELVGPEHVESATCESALTPG